MFDYQAGEKFKLTLIMVGFVGVMAGMLFTMLIMPSSSEPPRHTRHVKWALNPDVTGQAAPNPVAPAANNAAIATAGVNAADALNLVSAWLPSAWDLSAGTANGSQEKAIMYMTPECAAAYKQNIWTPDLAKQIEESGLHSSFNADKVTAGNPQADGSVIIFVEGKQSLTIPGKSTRERPVKLQYLVKQTSAGLRIAGISEDGQSPASG